MTKVDIISGFLGAGKTTFIKRLVTDVFQGEKIVLIENEFGEIGIDGGFLKDAGIEITEMNSGCICCTLVGDFSEALKKVVDQYHPDRIIIEPSGVGKLSDVAGAVRNVEEHCGIELNSCITVADGKKVKIYLKNFGEFYSNQIEHAATIVLSRTQSMTDSKLKEAVALIREENPDAAIITTPWDQLDGEVIRNAVEQTSKPTDLLNEACLHHDHDGCCHHDHEDCGCHEHHHHDHEGHHHADEVFTSWGVETPRRYGAEELQQMLEKLEGSSEYGIILRAKGILQNTDGSWMQFDLVPEEYEVRGGSPEYTGRLCVIGSKLNEDALKELFQV